MEGEQEVPPSEELLVINSCYERENWFSLGVWLWAGSPRPAEPLVVPHQRVYRQYILNWNRGWVGMKGGGGSGEDWRRGGM